MGLLDDLYIGHNANFGGQGGGLLDFLRTSQMQQDQYQPSAGLPQQFHGAGRAFDTATFDPSTYAPNQAQPIAVGNYQMPRVGSADQFTPPMNAMAQLPPNAQPTQGQLPQMAPMQAPQQQMAPQQSAQALPPAFGGGSVLGRLGNPDGLIARLTGNDSRSIGQQNLRAQYEAIRQTLIANGDSPQAASSKAMVAAMNPEAAKTILPELFTNKQKFQVVKDDPLTGKQYGFVNERDQTINDKPINAQQESSGGLAGIQAAQNAGITGDALYEHLPAAMRNTVKAMIEGRQPLPSTTAMRSPATLALIDAAHTIDPAFDATVWKSRNEAGPDWSKGKSSEMVRSANQTLAHVGSLMNAMDALKNRGMPAWNAVANTVSEQFGTGEQGSFRTNAHAVAEEMSKVFKGANLSDSEIRHWEQNLSENMSPTQQRAQVAKLSELLHGSLQALEEKRLAAMGSAAAAKAGPLIKEEGQQVLQRIDKWVKNNAAPGQSESSGKPATVIQNGHTYTLQSDGSYK